MTLHYKTHKLPILFIIIVSATLHFWNLFNIPLTHDELSAILRLQYSTFGELVVSGCARFDTHPIGVQAFLFYYCKVFGYTPWVIKLPFILAGIWSVWLIFVVTKLSFGTTSALFAASIYSTLQYTIENTLVARPYAMGALFILLSIWFLQKLSTRKPLNALYLAGYITSLTLASYTHYLALVTAIIIWIWGLVLIQRSQFKWYILLFALLILAGLPHLSITLIQLSKGGIEGWIGPFKLYYPAIYARIVLQHSFLIALGTSLLIIGLLNFKLNVRELKFRYFYLAVFCSVFLIGAGYSYFIKNILHDKSLYFAFPFLLIFTASFIKDVGIRGQIILVTLIIGMNLISLTKERRHFSLFYKNSYPEIVKAAESWPENFCKKDKVAITLYGDREMFHYLNPNLSDSVYNLETKTTPAEFYNWIKNQTTPYLYYGSANTKNPVFLSIALSRYPNIVHCAFTVGGEAYLLTKSHITPKYNQVIFDTLIKTQWPLNPTFDTIYFSAFNTAAYLTSYTNRINIITSIYSNDTLNIHSTLNFYIKIGGRPYQTINTSLSGYSKTQGQFQVHTTLNLADMGFGNPLMIQPYIEIKKGEKIEVLSIQYVIEKGNPVIYGHLKKIPFNLDFNGF